MEQNLSDNQRRTICRVLFLLVCALPTCVTIYFATHQRSANEWAQLIQAELGVKTSIEAVESLRPGEMVFHDVKLYDDRGKVIFESLVAKATLGNKNSIEFQSRVQVSTDGVSHFLNEAAGRLVNPNSTLKPWRVFFKDIVILDEKTAEFNSFQSNGVSVELGDGFSGSKVTLETNDWGKVQMKRVPESGAIQVEVVTNRDDHVPCWLVRNWFPAIETLVGTNAHFSGIARIYLGNHHTYDISGNFIEVDVPNAPFFINEDDKSVIQVEGLTLENSQWTEGMAWVLSEGVRYELPNPKS